MLPSDKNSRTISKDTNTVLTNIDIVFPIIHGIFGEDGT